MPDMRVIVAAVSGVDVQYECTIGTGMNTGGVITLTLGGNINQQHTDIINAAKTAMTAAYGVTFVPSDKIELWCGRAV